MLCEFLFFSLQSPHLCNMKQKGYQNAAFGCFALMPFYDIDSFFYRGDNDYRNSSVSFCNAEPLLISDFFSAPLAKQKETRYNMTKRTELVIFKEAWAWLLPTMKQNNFTRRC